MTTRFMFLPYTSELWIVMDLPISSGYEGVSHNFGHGIALNRRLAGSNIAEQMEDSCDFPRVRKLLACI